MCAALPSVPLCGTLKRCSDCAFLTEPPEVLAITDVGFAVLSCVTEMLQCYEELANISNEAALEIRGHIRLQVPSLFEATRLGSAIKRFVKAFPLVSVDLRITDSGRVLLADTEDLARCVGRDIPDTLIERPLGATSLGMFASLSYLAMSDVPAHPDDLKPG
jgi:DNA-binding transcriptional LysR family regulator